MCCKNGKTFLNSILPLGGTSTTYVFDLTHYLCGNRKTCVVSLYPPSAVLNYKLTSVEQVGEAAYAGTILVTGTVTYMPYCGCSNGCYTPCPRTENIYTTITVPLGSATGNTITEGIVNASTTPLSDCNLISDTISITSSVTVSAASAG